LRGLSSWFLPFDFRPTLLSRRPIDRERPWVEDDAIDLARDLG
jgi:hypothetical protein